MKKIAVFPGSFDPITKGHEAVIKRAVPLFDKIYVALGSNSEKTSLFQISKRLQWIKDTFIDYKNIDVIEYSGLTINLCSELQAKYIIRGLRNSIDFEFERNISQMNKEMAPDIETIFLLTNPEFLSINSTIVREIIKNNGDYKAFVPKAVTL